MLMGNLKSLHSLWVNLARNRRYSNYVCEKDIESFTNRFEHEGITFLTSVLPTLGKAIDEFHATTVWNCPTDFKSVNNIPIFMGDAIKNALIGDSIAVDCVRQLSYVFYKLEVDYDEGTVKQFLEKFRCTDRDIADVPNIADSNTRDLVASMKRIISRILCNTDPRDIRPCHGSGATACRTVNWEKWHLLRYYPKLDHVFPYSDYFFYNFTHLSDEMDKLHEIVSSSVPMARVVLVPKDSRGPRVISCEPAELLFIQQGLMRKLYSALENHPLTAGQINFADQTVNQRLAKSSSVMDDLATIDLSDASDRVSLNLVRGVFPPAWVECLEACRSEDTILPDGEIVKLNKFAPMGSSVCFPVEALVFWACAEATQQRVSPRSRENIFVYGDDIIIPSYLYDDVVRGLTSIGLLVNEKKSFRKGPFRESCGGDYHKGYDVTPVRVRKTLSSEGTSIATCADLINTFVNKFGYADSLSLIREIEEAVGYVYPRTELKLPVSIQVTPGASNDVFFRRRWNFNLQRLEHRVLSLSSKALAKQQPNWAELFRKELTREHLGNRSGEYGNRIAISDASLEPGWYTDIHSARQKWTWVWLG